MAGISAVVAGPCGLDISHPIPALPPVCVTLVKASKGTVVSAAHMLTALYRDKAWNFRKTTALDTKMAPYILGPCFPDFIQVARSQQGFGGGGCHKVGPDLSWSPGGTTHHALWMGGAQGELGGPSRSLCTREKAVSTWVPPSPGP